MKNPRNIVLSEQMLAAAETNTNPPPQGSLFWKMWNANLDIAQKALNTDFVQGIANGNLNPVTYGGFNVSDAYYCFHGASSYLAAMQNAKDPTLKAYLEHKYTSYTDYNKTFPTTWRVKDATSIVPTSVCKAYTAFEDEICNNEAPIYALVVMLPCSYLWYWLGAQLNPPKAGNIYAKWVTDNLYPQGAHAMGNFLEAYQKSYPGQLDTIKAMDIYSKAINFEWQNFVHA